MSTVRYARNRARRYASRYGFPHVFTYSIPAYPCHPVRRAGVVGRVPGYRQGA